MPCAEGMGRLFDLVIDTGRDEEDVAAVIEVLRR
jgi:hypothetical protein